jgi:uncharacterized protein (TIRG00374 family)
VPSAWESVDEVSLKERFFNLRTLIAFGLALSFLIFILTRFDIDLSATWEKMKGGDPALYALAVITYFLSFPLRGWRWRLLLNNVGFRRDQGVNLPSSLGLGGTVLVSWFANCVLYARLGDAYRAYLLKEDTNVSFSKTLGTVVAERVIDMAIVFLMLTFAGLALWGGWGGGTASAILAASFSVAVILGLALLAMWRFGTKVERRLPSRLRSYWTSFQEGTVGSFQQLPLIIGISVVIWLLEAGRLLLVTHSLGFSLGLLFILFIALANALLTALPLTPGGLGLVEPGVAGLLTINLARADAWSIALIDRSITYLGVVILGAIVFFFRQLKLAQRPRLHPSLPDDPATQSGEVSPGGNDSGD